MCWPDSNIAIPTPTPFSDLLPSVNICIGLLSSFPSSILVFVSAGCCQCLTPMLVSNFYSAILFSSMSAKCCASINSASMYVCMYVCM